MRADFTLPGGLLDADGTCHRRGQLRALDGFDEEWIHSLPPSTSQAAFITGLLARCVRRIGPRRASERVLRELTVGDRDYLVLKLYQTTFGDRISLVLTCPREACGAKMDLDLQAAEIPVEEREVAASYRLALQAGEIEFRLPRGSDQERLAESEAAGVDDARARLLDACVIGGAIDDGERARLIEAIEERAPRVEDELEARCPECGETFDARLDVTELFLQQVARGRASFDREIHLLAFHYHWPLRELFSLTRARRQRFLRLLIDELGARAV